MSLNLPDPTTAPPWHLRAYEPTVTEVAHWLATTSHANREWWVERIRQQVAEAQNCLMHEHVQQIDQLKRRLSEKVERIAYLERNYGRPL